jgi:hypothetical protein
MPAGYEPDMEIEDYDGNIDPTPHGEDYNGRYAPPLPPGPGYDPTDPMGPPPQRIPGEAPSFGPPGFADGPPISGPQYEGNRSTIEDFLREMLERGSPVRPPMDDSQIPLDRPDRNARGNVVTPVIDPSANTLDNEMEIPSDVMTERGMNRIDSAEQLVQQMIHKNLNNRKFR